MKSLILSILITVSFITLDGYSAWAGSVNIPNTFSSGTAAMASEMNDNFSAVKTAVDDNDSRISALDIVVKANGKEIGKFVNMDGRDVTILNSNGYLVKIRHLYGHVKNANFYTYYYSDTGCQGTMYMDELINGSVLRDWNLTDDYTDDTFLYIEKGAIPEEVTINSQRNGLYGQCSDATITLTLNPVLSDDGSITGVAALYDLPITIER